MLELKNIKSNSVIVVAGPTASGKSALAIDLALRYNGEIVNADSMQVYAGTPIISASPTDEEKKLVPHHLYEIYPPSKKGAVTEWLNLAVAKIKDIWLREKLPILVGGTGFYIESLINGTSPIPETSSDIKNKVAKIMEQGGVDALYKALLEADPLGAEMVKPKDTSRVRRALEIFWDTGVSISEWFKLDFVKLLPDAEFEVIVLLPKLTVLEEKCSKRFDSMMQQGALEEAKQIYDLNLASSLPAMKAIGIPELINYLQGNISLEDAVKLAKLHTRQYAKRQLTWFRNRLKNNASYIIE